MLFRSIARLPALSVFVYNPRGTPSGAATGIAPLGPSGFIAGAGSHFAAGNSATPSIILYNDGGGVERTFALPYVAGQFEDSEVAAARRLRLEEATSEFGRSLLEAVYSKTARPATKPVLGGLRRGTDGSFWVWPFSLAADAATTYHVVAMNGDLVATLSRPLLPAERPACCGTGRPRSWRCARPPPSPGRLGTDSGSFRRGRRPAS